VDLGLRLVEDGLARVAGALNFFIVTRRHGEGLVKLEIAL
jgi:hypothetical protein